MYWTLRDSKAEVLCCQTALGIQETLAQKKSVKIGMWVERLHRDPTPKEEAKLREFADGIQKAMQEEQVAMQKLSDAIENYRS